MSILNGQGSGTNPVAATADWNLSWQTKNNLLVADGFGNVAGSGLVLQQTTMTLTSAQLLQLATTPVQVVAPNGGIIIPISGVCYYTAGTVAYTEDANTYIVFGYPSMVGSYGYTAYCYIQPGLDQLTNQQLPVSAEGYAATPPGIIQNEPIVAFLYGFDNLTLGNGTLTVTLFYFTITPNAQP